MPLYLSNPVLGFYFLISVFLLLISYFSIRAKSRQLDNINFIFVFVLMVCFYGTRYPGTTDTKMYLSYFDNMTNFASFPWGIGFYYLMDSIKTLSRDHSFYVLISSSYALVALALVVLLFLRGGYYKSLCLISFLYSWSFLDLMTNTYRQGITVPFVILFAYFFGNRRYLLAVAMAGIALSLHWSAVLIIFIVLVGVLLKNRTRLLRLLTIFSLAVFSVSFFVNINLAEMLAKGTLLTQFQNVFVGVNLTSKVNAYLGAGVDGASFYDMAGYQRIYYSGEIYIAAVIIGLYFIFNYQELAQSRAFMSAYAAFLMITIYGILLISMTWFIRNFYWGVPLSQILYIYLLMEVQKKRPGIFNVVLLSYMVLIVALGTATMWRVPLLLGSYP